MIFDEIQECIPSLDSTENIVEEIALTDILSFQSGGRGEFKRGEFKKGEFRKGGKKRKFPKFPMGGMGGMNGMGGFPM